MKITLCIGSFCHLKGSRRVKEKLCSLIEQHNLQDKVELCATFCMGNCQEGVAVTIDDATYSVHPESVEEFFQSKVLAVLK